MTKSVHFPGVSDPILFCRPSTRAPIAVDGAHAALTLFFNM
jgi:hypothetical protein